MKYPLAVVPAAVDWHINDADGAFVAAAYTEADANAIRDAMNKCAPRDLPTLTVPPFDCWGYAIGVKSKPFNAEADRDAAVRAAEMLGTRPVRGRFIPDNLTAADVYAEVARLLNMTERDVESPSVKGEAAYHGLSVRYEADINWARILWDADTVEAFADAMTEAALDHRDEADHDWDQMEADYRADADADARQSDAD